MRVAVFGKPGGGKSTIGRRIAAHMGAQLYQLDLIQFGAGGVRVPDEVFEKAHAEILERAHWVIDGFGTPSTFQAMTQAANVLVYVERAAWVHYWWVTKRLLKSPFTRPLGWPEGSPILRSTLSSYRYLRLSPRFWSRERMTDLLAMRPSKQVFVIRNRYDEMALLSELKSQANRN